jgi:iron(III) transport system ATP-binding protein
VALARALAPGPRVLLLDEPFSALDAGLRMGTRLAVARALAAAGVTTILVTHDQSEALSLAGQVAVMRRGRLVQTASPDEVYRAPVDSETAMFVGAAVILPGEVAGGIARCALGTIPTWPDTPRGPVEVMVRPEQIVIHPPGAPGVVAARVVHTTYYGHDAIVAVRLASGDVITVRPPGHTVPSIGQEVGLAVTGKVHAFAATAAASELGTGAGIAGR